MLAQTKRCRPQHGDRPASAASQLRLSAQRGWPTRRHTGCLQTTQEGKSWLRPPGPAFNDQAGDLLHRLQPAIYQRNWLTWLPLTLPSPALGKIQATGVYMQTTGNMQAPMYTDGLTSAGPLTPLFTKQQRRPANTSSYDEEKVAMRMVLEWLLPSQPWPSALIAISFLKRSRTALPTLQTTLLSIPGHEISGNCRRCAPTSQCTNLPKTNGPFSWPLQNNGSLHQDVFMAGRLSGCLHVARRRSSQRDANQLDKAVDP